MELGASLHPGSLQDETREKSGVEIIRDIGETLLFRTDLPKCSDSETTQRDSPENSENPGTQHREPTEISRPQNEAPKTPVCPFLSTLNRICPSARKTLTPPRYFPRGGENGDIFQQTPSQYHPKIRER